MKRNNRIPTPAFTYIKGVSSVAIIFLLGLSGSLRAQEAYRVADPDIKVLGTSNLHNWTMEAKVVTCSANFVFGPAGNGLPQSLTALDLVIPVHNLKSGESLMDSRAYGALKADKFETINYTSTSASIVPGKKNQFQVNSMGTMTIAGVTKSVALIVGCQVNADASITCTGSQQLKMTDYQIKPPSFMLGALKTGDLLTINYSLILKK
jgi:polyisoprenoid-binding protein YceI